MRHVLAAIDSDASAEPVLNSAIALADLFDATAVALHVREPGSGSLDALTRLAGVELREVSGAPVAEIVAAAERPDVVGLALGARCGPGGPLPGGHTALEVITQVTRPVAIVPPDAHPPARFARLLVPLEGTAKSSRALDETIALAHRRQLEILVLHVHSPATVPKFSDHEPHGTQAWDREFLARNVAVPRQDVKLIRHLGVPADDVVAVAEETAADLIVLTWSQKLAKGRARIVCETIAHTNLPILLLPIVVNRRGTKRPRIAP